MDRSVDAELSGCGTDPPNEPAAAGSRNLEEPLTCSKDIWKQEGQYLEARNLRNLHGKANHPSNHSKHRAVQSLVAPRLETCREAGCRERTSLKGHTHVIEI